MVLRFTNLSRLNNMNFKHLMPQIRDSLANFEEVPLLTLWLHHVGIVVEGSVQMSDGNVRI